MKNGAFFPKQRQLSVASASEPTMSSHFDDDSYTREIFQNSLDAKAPESNKVRVVFEFGDASKELIKILNIKDIINRASNAPKFSKHRLEQIDVDAGVKVLRIEDFGTTGLTGEPNQKSGSPFNTFMMHWGGSEKQGDNGGRWGLGRSVNWQVSLMQTFIGYTIRADGKHYVMGQAVLGSHKIGKQYYEPYGIFHNGEHSDDAEIKPYEGKDADKIAKLIGFKRKAGECGLSIASLYPKAMDEVVILKSIIMNNATNIISGKLETCFNGIEINAENIAEKAKEVLAKLRSTNAEYKDIKDMQGMIKYIIFIKKVYDKDNEINVFEAKFNSKNNCIREDSFTTEDFKKVQDDWAKGRMFAVKVKVPVKPFYGKHSQDSFTVFMQNNGETGFSIYQRQGIVMSAISGSHKDKEKYFSLTNAENGTLASFLGDSEGPDHSDWKKNFVEDKYDRAEKNISLIRNASRQIASSVTLKEVETDYTHALAKFFPRMGSVKRTIYPNLANNDAKSHDAWVFKKNKENNIASIRLSNAGKDWVKEQISKGNSPKMTVLIDYNGVSGNKFNRKRFKFFDFTNDKKHGIVNINGDVEYILHKDEIIITKMTDDFEIQITDFDKNRDMVAKVTFDENEMKEVA